MLADFILGISGLPKADGPVKLTLKIDPIYVNVWKAMGPWSIENPSANLSSGHTSLTGSQARWFWDPSNTVMQLKMGWMNKEVNDNDAKPVFDLINYKDLLRVGDAGGGNFITLNKHQYKIHWKVLQITGSSILAMPKEYRYPA